MVTIAPGNVAPPAEAFRLQSRMIVVRPGMHLIRYVSAKAVDEAPVVLIQPMPEDASGVSLLASGGGATISLNAPGDVVVVKALREARLVVTTASLGWLGADAAVLQVERIDRPAADSGRGQGAVAKVDLVGEAPAVAAVSSANYQAAENSRVSARK